MHDLSVLIFHNAEAAWRELGGSEAQFGTLAPAPLDFPNGPPTIEEAVDLALSRFPVGDKWAARNDPVEWVAGCFGLAASLRGVCRLWHGNDALMKSAYAWAKEQEASGRIQRPFSSEVLTDPDECSVVIAYALWLRLQDYTWPELNDGSPAFVALRQAALERSGGQR